VNWLVAAGESADDPAQLGELRGRVVVGSAAVPGEATRGGG
jgi:hypothetical protein